MTELPSTTAAEVESPGSYRTPLKQLEERNMTGVPAQTERNVLCTVWIPRWSRAVVVLAIGTPNHRRFNQFGFDYPA